MTNGSPQEVTFENPQDLISPGDFESIRDVYAAHGKPTDGPSTFMGALDEYFEEHGQTRTEGGNYTPRMYRQSVSSSDTSLLGSPAGIALEYSTISSVLRQLTRAKRNAGSNTNISKINNLESKIRDIESSLGYGNLDSKDVYLSDLLYLDSELNQFLNDGGSQTSDTPRDILEYRQGMQEAEAALSAAAGRLREAFFAELGYKEGVKKKFKKRLEDNKKLDPDKFDIDAWVPDYAVSNALGLYPFWRQVDIIDNMTSSLEKHGEGAAILLEILRTGVPFDPLALFSVPVNHGQMDLAMAAPQPLKKRGDEVTFVPREEVTEPYSEWMKIGQIISDPVADQVHSAVSDTFEVVDRQAQITGIEKKYRIDATTVIGTHLAKIAQRFASAVTSTLRGYQDRPSLDSDEKKRVEELCGYLAMLSDAFIDSSVVNAKLPGNVKIENLAGKVPAATADRQNLSRYMHSPNNPPPHARAKYKQNNRVQQTLPNFQDTLNVVHQVHSVIGDVLNGRLEDLKAAIEQDIKDGRITVPAGQSMEEFINEKGNWRKHNSELIEANRRFTNLNTLTSALQVGFTVIDHARFEQNYSIDQMIATTTSTFATAGQVAADIDSLLADNYSAYDTDLFVQRGLGEVAGSVADTVDVAITIKNQSVSAFNSVKIGNGLQAVEASTTALVSIGSVVVGYAFGGVVGAVIGAILDIVGTIIVDALFEDISDLEQWAKCTVFGTGLSGLSNAWGPWNTFVPATGTPAVHKETESDTGEGLTMFKWDTNAVRRVVGYYNMAMGFDVDTYEYGPVLSRSPDPDLEMKMVLKDIAFGQTDSKIAVCPVRWLTDEQCVVDPPYMILEMSSGNQWVTVNPAGMYGLPTKEVEIKCETNSSVQLSAPSGDWVQDVYAFEAYYSTDGSGRPVVWPPGYPSEGELWGFEIVHLMPTLPGKAADALEDRFSYSETRIKNSIENVPHPRGWIQPDGLWDYPP